MTEVTWKDLAKTVTDKTKISEEIDEKIKTHNEDPSAHKQADEAIDVHRTGTVLDHPDASVEYDKLALSSVDLRKLCANKYFVFCAFESVDGWSQNIESGGSITPQVLGLIMRTGDVNHRLTQMTISPFYDSGVPDFSKNPFLQTSFKLNKNVFQYADIGCGLYMPGDSSGKWFGFRIVDNVLYASCMENGTRTDAQITGINITDVHVYRADLDSSGAEINFYVDGVLKQTITTNIPTGIASRIFGFSIITVEDDWKALLVLDLLWSQDH